MDYLTHVQLGGVPVKVEYGRLLHLPASKATAGHLYAARMAAVRRVKTPYFSLLDGGDDALLPGYWEVMAHAVDMLQRTAAAIATTHETLHGKKAEVHPHHGVVCSKAAFDSVEWPRGCHHFESVVYPRLSDGGVLHLPHVVYDWRPDGAGASRWATTTRARVNAALWLEGRDGVHFSSDFVDQDAAWQT